MYKELFVCFRFTGSLFYFFIFYSALEILATCLTVYSGASSKVFYALFSSINDDDQVQKVVGIGHVL